MLDTKLISENPKLIKDNLKKRFQKNKIKQVDEIIKFYTQWKTLKQKIDSLRAKRNKISQEINKLKKSGSSIKEKVKQVKKIPLEIKSTEKQAADLKNKIDKILLQLPNILDKSVPIGKTEKQNKVIKKVGKIPKFKFKIKNHVELIEKLDLADFDASAKVSGNGFYFLKGKLAILNQALIRFAIDFMLKKEYTYIEPPLMVKKEIAEAAEDFEAFKTKIYKAQDENLFLIPTSEHAILGMLSGKTIPEEKLPLRFFGYSMCFRREIGAHGINEKGLWRTHQFNKVEQFIFCKPKDSMKYYDELQKNTEKIYQALKIPYRIFESCSGDLSDWKVKGSDLEAYRPTTKKYEEVGSLSDCGSYQARDLNIKGINKKGKRYILHTLNNTALATSRTMVAIIENYQQKEGSIKVPAVLQKYTHFKKIAGV